MIWAKIKHTDSVGQVGCCTCGIVTHRSLLSGGHFIPQAKGNSTRFELDNVNQQCNICNGKANQWEQFKHGQYIDRTYWEGRAEQLWVQSRGIKSWKIWELEEAIEIVESLIYGWYQNQSEKQQKILVGYMTKNWIRKKQCKWFLESIWYYKYKVKDSS